ncbi:MAG: Nramp family divalent metal transporter, partial [Patescibacteria group bacterium]
MNLTPLKRSVLVDPPSFGRMVGPSFILLGLGLGIGELILWPYLTASYGLGIIWGAVAGITMQLFINLEISRYTLVTGESVFVGLSRKLGKVIPIWFIVSTILPWMWPGIVLSGSRLLTAGLGWGRSDLVGVVALLLIGAILSLGPVLYGTQEKLEK